MRLEDKTLCFVTGCPRSGTTAMVQLLNCHPDLAITNERYFSAIKQADFGRAYFARERLDRFEQGDGYPHALKAAETLRALDKVETAQVIGDKVPHVKLVMDAAKRIGRAKVIALLRDPVSVLLSFDARARRSAAHTDPDPGWPAHFDHAEGLKRFNHAVRHLLAAARKTTEERGFDLLVVDYADVFRPGGGTDGIFRFLGVDPAMAEGVSAVQATLDDRRLHRDRIHREAALGADYARYRSLHERIVGYHEASA